MADGAPDVLLTRLVERGEGCYGYLTVGTFACFTVERPWLQNASDNPATALNESSCIPRGQYRLKLQFSPHFQKDMWHVLGVADGRQGIEIHGANRASELKGCIAPGDTLGHEPQGWFVTNSQATLKAFCAAMGTATEGDLTIMDSPGTQTDLFHQVSPVTGGPV